MGGGDIVDELGMPPPYHQIDNSASRHTTTNPQANSQVNPHLRRPSSQQQTHHARNNIPNSNSSRTVVHACDDKGRCIFHPHIQLRKKAIMGVIGGWKDILRICPDCERQELQILMKREADDIERLELMMRRLDEHDVEYLNDDGVDDDGNYVPSSAGDANSVNQRGRVQITFNEGVALKDKRQAMIATTSLPNLQHN